MHLGVAVALEVVGIHLFLFVFQVAGCVHLLRTAKGRSYVSLFAALLGVNAGLSAVEAVVAVDPAAPGAADWISAGGLLDLLTVPLLAGALLDRFTKVRRAVWAPILGAVALAHVIAAALMPDIREGIPDLVLRGGPYYAALVATGVLFARGDPSDRWLALAFLPRALYYGVFPLMGPEALFARELAPRLNSWGFLFMLGGALGAVGLLLKKREPPHRAVVILVVAATAALALVSTMSAATTRASLAVNFLSLGLVRPLFTYIALCREEVPAILGGSVFAALLGMAGSALGPALSLSSLGTGLLALSLTCLAFAGMDAFLSRRAFAPPRSTGPGAPHWMRVLVALRGSSVGGAPRPEWTQRGLAHRTGVGVRRVSEFPHALNASAARKLARHVADWSPEGAAGPLRLVETFRGAVPGERGVVLYYRLTPLGERLAHAVSRELDDQIVKIDEGLPPERPRSR